MSELRAWLSVAAARAGGAWCLVLATSLVFSPAFGAGWLSRVLCVMARRRGVRWPFFTVLIFACALAPVSQVP